MPTPQEIIEIAKISQYLAGNAIESRGLYGGNIYAELERKLYVERKSVEWKYTYDPTNTTDLVATANYLYALCAPFNLLAADILGGGGGGTVIVPTGGGVLATLMIEIGAADFFNTTDYNDSRIVGKELKVFSNGIPRFLYNENPPAPNVQEWDYTPSGITILIPGFDSSAIDYHFFIFVVGSISNTSSGSARTRTITVTGTDTYVLDYTPYINTYGTYPQFQVYQDQGGGMQTTGILGVPDNKDNPSTFTFSALGNFETKIVMGG